LLKTQEQPMRMKYMGQGVVGGAGGVDKQNFLVLSRYLEALQILF
jgi:hypothetical protein